MGKLGIRNEGETVIGVRGNRDADVLGDVDRANLGEKELGSPIVGIGSCSAGVGGVIFFDAVVVGFLECDGGGTRAPPLRVGGRETGVNIVAA
jgi:hypothetical protein